MGWRASGKVVGMSKGEACVGVRLEGYVSFSWNGLIYARRVVSIVRVWVGYIDLLDPIIKQSSSWTLPSPVVPRASLVVC
jgi:hypothetical protein